MPHIPPEFFIDGFYSLIIIVFALMIFFSTRDIHKLSSHKGLGYFRNAFLFFAIAYFFRFIIKIAFILLNYKTLFFYGQFISIATLFVFVYASTMAMFYLLYSVMWKKLPRKYENIFVLHIVAIIVSIISITTKDNFLILLVIQALVFLYVAIESYRSYKRSRRRKGVLNVYIIYILLFVFWILNILEILTPNFLGLVQMLIYAASVGLFSLILYKVLRKTGV